MDEPARRMRELVVEAVVLARSARTDDVLSRLSGLRDDLLSVCEDTVDAEASDAACGAVHDLDEAIARLTSAAEHEDPDEDCRLVS